MAEEDLIFGKNRHFFGGIEPANMQTFHAKNVYSVSTGASSIMLTCVLPEDTEIDGQHLCSVAGAVIRKSTDGYPETEFDGDAVATITEDTTLTDSDVELDTTYYYAAFPYSSQGVYNRNAANQVSITAAKYTWLYGYDLATSTSSPSSRVTYPDDVDNADYTAAAMGSSSFDYGSWDIEPGEQFMPRPCMLYNGDSGANGQVAYYLDPDDYTLQEDGETASDIASTSFTGNAMMEWNKIYTNRWEDDDGYHFRCCDQALDENYDCWCNYDANDNEIDHFYTAIYSGYVSSSVMRSISGLSNTASNTASAENTYAQANGDGWNVGTLADWLLIGDLLVMMAKTTNCQLAYGYGYCASSNSAQIGSGSHLNAKGLFYGSVSVQTSRVKVFGMEDWWGNMWNRIVGWINDNGTQKIKLTEGTHDGSTVSGYNLTGDGYIELSDATPSGTSGGYISSMQTTAFGRIPVTASGSSTTYEADGLWYDNSQVDVACVGGGWVRALFCGPFCAYLSGLASRTNTAVGASLSCKPLAS